MFQHQGAIFRVAVDAKKYIDPIHQSIHLVANYSLQMYFVHVHELVVVMIVTRCTV